MQHPPHSVALRRGATRPDGAGTLIPISWRSCAAFGVWRQTSLRRRRSSHLQESSSTKKTCSSAFRSFAPHPAPEAQWCAHGSNERLIEAPFAA